MDLSRILAALKPGVLVDARMRKHDQPEIQITFASFTIGLGPNFIAGKTVHAAVETGYEGLGEVIWHGATRPLQGDPKTIRISYGPSLLPDASVIPSLFLWPARFRPARSLLFIFESSYLA